MIKGLLRRIIGPRYRHENGNGTEPMELSSDHLQAEMEQRQLAERLRDVADRLQVEMDVYRRTRRDGTPRTSH